MIYFGTNHVKPATYLIPNNFRGKVIIYYGEPCGIKTPEVDGRYILKIPANGIMILKSPLETGIIDEDYYFTDANYKKIKKIDQLEQQDFNEDYILEKNKNEPSRKEVAILLGGTGSGEHVDLKNKRYTFSEFYVNCWDSLRVNNDSKADSLSLTLLNNCRTQR